jgi:hypothetical protein
MLIRDTFLAKEGLYMVRIKHQPASGMPCELAERVVPKLIQCQRTVKTSQGGSNENQPL